jgi:hypothetical protein
MADLSPKRVRTGNDKLRVEGTIEKAVGAVQNADEEAQDKAGNALQIAVVMGRGVSFFAPPPTTILTPWSDPPLVPAKSLMAVSEPPPRRWTNFH